MKFQIMKRGQRVRRIHKFEERHKKAKGAENSPWNSRSWKEAPTGAENSPIRRKTSSTNVQRLHRLKFQIMKGCTNGCGEFTNLKKDIIQECTDGCGEFTNLRENGYCWKNYHPRMHNGWRIYQLDEIEEQALHHPRGHQRSPIWRKASKMKSIEERHCPSIQFTNLRK